MNIQCIHISLKRHKQIVFLGNNINAWSAECFVHDKFLLATANGPEMKTRRTKVSVTLYKIIRVGSSTLFSM